MNLSQEIIQHLSISEPATGLTQNFGTSLLCRKKLLVIGELHRKVVPTSKCHLFYFILNLLTETYIDFTDLRKSIVYYNLYCIWTNNVFASFIPFLSLLFFNVSIAMELNSKANRKKVSSISNIWLPLQTVSTNTNK